MSGKEIWRGFRATLPLWFGVAPFGIAYALAAKASGISVVQAIGMSLLAYAGAVQVATAHLLASGSTFMTLMLTALLVHSRMLLPSGALAPYLRHLSRARRALLAFALADATYVLSMPEVSKEKSDGGFLFGSNLSLYICWNLSTAAGLFFQGVLGDLTKLGLELVIPLSFLVLLVPYTRSMGGMIAASAGGSVALAARLWLPGSWHILLGALAGSLAALSAEGNVWKRG